MRDKARVAAQAFGLANGFKKTFPVLVVVNQHTQHAVTGGVRFAVGGQQACIAGFANRRLKAQPGHVITQNELGHGFKHGYYHSLPHARLTSCI